MELLAQVRGQDPELVERLVQLGLLALFLLGPLVKALLEKRAEGAARAKPPRAPRPAAEAKG
ncbi:MAG TPA: hypothetical protein VJP77_00960, partial [Planctomycetota bacterium]|nr:hypothetical protein [Planctomycetota bacterium]